jgi:shikimate kinase
MIRLVGPGGAGKSTVGALLAKRLELAFLSVVLLPSLDRESCVTETVRRQIARPFGRSSAKEEAVIRARFETYMALPARKIETMRPVSTVVDGIVAALSLEKRPQTTSDR